MNFFVKQNTEWCGIFQIKDSIPNVIWHREIQVFPTWVWGTHKELKLHCKKCTPTLQMLPLYDMSWKKFNFSLGFSKFPVNLGILRVCLLFYRPILAFLLRFSWDHLSSEAGEMFVETFGSRKSLIWLFISYGKVLCDSSVGLKLLPDVGKSGIDRVKIKGTWSNYVTVFTGTRNTSQIIISEKIVYPRKGVMQIKEKGTLPISRMAPNIPNPICREGRVNVQGWFTQRGRF